MRLSEALSDKSDFNIIASLNGLISICVLGSLTFVHCRLGFHLLFLLKPRFLLATKQYHLSFHLHNREI